VIRSLAIGLVLGTAFLALALWGVPLRDLERAFAQMEWVYVILLSLAWALQYALRAVRQFVLVRPLAPRTTLRAQVSIVIVGFFCINVFPARLGEAARPYLWYERDGVPLGSGFALVLVERVLDLVALFITVLAVVAFVDLPDRAVELAGQRLSLVELGRIVAVGVGMPALAAIAGLAIFGPAALRVGERVVAALEARVTVPWLLRLSRASLRFATSVVEGVATLRSPTRLSVVVALTAALFWSMGLGMVFLAQAFGLDQIGFGPGMGVLAVTMFGIALPAPPGFAGVFEAAARAGLALFGVEGEEMAGRALAYALLFHWWPFLLLAGAAGFFLWRDRIGLGRVFRFARRDG
jgi:uncharacterized protein (TIRG00374 family)